MDGTIGEIRIFAGNFPPLNWSFCDGSALSIAEYTTLFSLIGTTYGGDGAENFQVPDLRSRIPVGTGQGPGLARIALGQMAGSESVTMSTNQMPSHNHVGTGRIAINAYKGTDTSGSPTGSSLAGLQGAYSTQSPDSFLKPETSVVIIEPTGKNNPFSIIQPYTASNYIICLVGIYPTRNS